MIERDININIYRYLRETVAVILRTLIMLYLRYKTWTPCMSRYIELTRGEERRGEKMRRVPCGVYKYTLPHCLHCGHKAHRKIPRVKL